MAARMDELLYAHTTSFLRPQCWKAHKEQIIRNHRADFVKKVP
jgi:hypothetical protein